MGKTSIEWCTDVWNPVTGCTKVSQGCKHCYAERVFPRAYGRQEALPSGGPPATITVAAQERYRADKLMRQRRFTDVWLHPERLDQPLRWKRPRRIFVNSMSDLFHEAVPGDFVLKVFDTMHHAPQHTFQILTKRPSHMFSFINDLGFNGSNYVFNEGQVYKPLPNVWLGVSCENQATADERIRLLMQTPAAVRFVSAEPLLGPIDLTAVLDPCAPDCRKEKVGAPPFSGHWHKGIDSQALHWVIVGGESGPGARPMHPDWVKSIRDQCVAAGVSFFFKQWGEWAPAVGRLLKEVASKSRLVSSDGCLLDDSTPVGKGTIMVRAGKKSAGCILGGREWKEFPGSEVEHHGA